MHYYEIIRYAFEFLMHEKIDEEICQEFFCLTSIKDKDFQKEIKKFSTYFELYILNRQGILSEKHQKLLTLLEKTLISYAPIASKI